MVSQSASPINLAARWRPLEQRVHTWLGSNILRLTRIALGGIYLWFGILKFLPGLSPAESLAGRTIEALSWGLVKPAVGLPALALLECGIGLALLLNLKPRRVALIVILHLCGTFTPLVLFPSLSFNAVGVPTLVGQYIAKNAVLLAAALNIYLHEFGKGPAT